MLKGIYKAGRFCMVNGWMVGLLLLVLTVVFGTIGFQNELVDTNAKQEYHTFLDALYKGASLLAIQTGSVHITTNWQLEFARWTGMVFFSTALITFVVRLTREAIHRRLVRWLAKDHVIIAGLGQNGSLLVAKLAKQGKTIVIVEANREHPAIERCRELGAIILFGEPTAEGTLLAANLKSASNLLAIFLQESECMRIITAAYNILSNESATSAKPPVRCVLRVTEPGLLDVIRRHKIKTVPNDRIQLEILNPHEIAATNMVREAKLYSPGNDCTKLLILGLGTHHRLGELLLLRAAKDHLILNNGKPGEKLKVHIYDNESTSFVRTMLSRYPFLNNVCDIDPHQCWARKVGTCDFSGEYDAAFICIDDDGHGTAQAVMLRRDVLKNNQPIMVRVSQGHSGYGLLLSQPNAGWGENIHPIGLEDPLFDPDMATRPESELRAQTIHQDALARRRRFTEAADKPWRELPENFRNDNRKLAERYAAHLESLEPARKATRYRWEYRPDAYTITSASPLLFEFPELELESLAAREHFIWKQEREADGWTWGPVKDTEKKTNPNLVDYSKLTDENTKAYNLGFVKRIPLVLALADYVIVPIPDDKS